MMQFHVKTKTRIIKRRLRLVKTAASRYVVRVDDEKEIGTIWKDYGRVKKFRNHLLDGTHEIQRWCYGRKDYIHQWGTVFRTTHLHKIFNALF
jgi:hypothetical protein